MKFFKRLQLTELKTELISLPPINAKHKVRHSFGLPAKQLTYNVGIKSKSIIDDWMVYRKSKYRYMQHFCFCCHFSRAAGCTIVHQSCLYGLPNHNTCTKSLMEAHLHSHPPHQGLHLTAVCSRNHLEWADAHSRWRLALWRGVRFTDEYRFSLYRADGRRCMWSGLTFHVRQMAITPDTDWIYDSLK